MSHDRKQTEQPIEQVRGTFARFGRDLADISRLSTRVGHQLELAGYDPIVTPLLDLVELHERKSGAAISTRVVELGFTGDQGPICLRPELTVGVVRTLIEAGRLGSGPVRVAIAGNVYRLPEKHGAGLNEIAQIGAELIGDATVEADAEVIALADSALNAAGVANSTILLGDVGLILEAVTAAGLPEETRKAVVETLADAAASGQGLEHVENALEHWADWLGDQTRPKNGGQTAAGVPGHELQRLFHHLVPQVVGRRTEGEILGRLRQKWALAERLPDALKKAARLVHELGGLAGEPEKVFARLKAHPAAALAGNSLARLEKLIDLLVRQYGIGRERIKVDLGVARGIGFYSGLVFSFRTAGTNPVEVAGGGRYDGLATVLGQPEGADFGVGFAIGLDRVVKSIAETEEEKVSIIYLLKPVEGSGASAGAACKLAERLRSAGHRARLATAADLADIPGQAWVEVAEDGTASVVDASFQQEFQAALKQSAGAGIE